MPFKLPDLPYPRDALEPYMSAETLDFHWRKHHKAYVDKTNQLLAAKGSDFGGGSLVEVVRNARKAGDTKLFNQAAQLWNHSFFWQCLAPSEGQKPGGRLVRMIDECFGSAEDMLKAFQEEAVNHFASGWAWLLLDRDTLKITSLHDADTPIAHDMVPLFTLDVWEHAYYIDYRNERPRFAESVLNNIVNWEFVERNLDGRGAERADQETGAETMADVGERETAE